MLGLRWPAQRSGPVCWHQWPGIFGSSCPTTGSDLHCSTRARVPPAGKKRSHEEAFLSEQLDAFESFVGSGKGSARICRCAWGRRQRGAQRAPCASASHLDVHAPLGMPAHPAGWVPRQLAYRRLRRDGPRALPCRPHAGCRRRCAPCRCAPSSWTPRSTTSRCGGGRMQGWGERVAVACSAKLPPTI